MKLIIFCETTFPVSSVHYIVTAITKTLFFLCFNKLNLNISVHFQHIAKSAFNHAVGTWSLLFFSILAFLSRPFIPIYSYKTGLHITLKNASWSLAIKDTFILYSLL